MITPLQTKAESAKLQADLMDLEIPPSVLEKGWRPKEREVANDSNQTNSKDRMKLVD